MQSRITVMHVLFHFGIGGLENGLVNLINRLDRDAFRHVVVCLAGYDQEFLRRVKVPNLEIHDLGKRPGQDFRVWWRMWRLLRKLRPTVLHTRNFATLELQLLGWLARVPGRVHGEHGWDMVDLDGRKTRYRIARRVLARFVHRFVALSKDLENYLVKAVGLAPAKVLQIYNGVDVEKFHPRADIDDQHGLCIGSVGRMKAVKNQTFLCKAFALFLERRPEQRPRVRLRLVGDGPLRKDCEAVLEAAGCRASVEFSGESARVAEELLAMDIFVLPSLAEGISNTILEAMASGLPVIATAVGGNPELVVDGQTGVLVPSDDAMALSKAIELYVLDGELRRLHGRQGRELAERAYSLSRMVADYEALYRTLARGDDHGPGHETGSAVATSKADKYK